MKGANKRNLRLFIHLDMRHAASREAVGGILRFAAMHHEWEVQFAGGHPSNEPIERFADWCPDALIIDSSCHGLAAGELASISGRAAVFVNTSVPRGWRKPCAQLTTDEQALASAAVALFRRKGLSHFAFVGAPCPDGGGVRKKYFCNALRDMGFSAETFVPTGSAMTWNGQQKEMAEWLRSLPKPCGVWVAFDQRAKHVLDGCRMAGIDVPEQIQVLGVDNETYICEHTVPSLSSLVLDFEGGGFEAAKYVDAVIKGCKPAPEGSQTKLHFAFKCAIERLSTIDICGTARHVAAAKEFIRKNAESGISVPHVAAAIGTSVRLLQRDFKAVTGHTMIEEIQNRKLEHVKELLRTTSTPIDSIGALCDFNSPAHLKTLFKKRFGMTMSAYRHTL